MGPTSLACTLWLVFTGTPPVPALVQTPFDGVWETELGLLTLTQEGQTVRGQLLREGKRFAGTGRIDKSELKLSLAAGDNCIDAILQLAADRDSFTGLVKINSEDRKWTGKRIKPEAPAVAALSFDGLWETKYGRMRLRQVADQVEGVYSYTSTSTIQGKVEKTKLTFTYKEPAAEGEGWFEIAADGKSFAGKWKEKGSSKWDDWQGKRIEPVPGRTWLVIIEANWESSLAQPEYAFGAMLRAFFAREPRIQVRHRFFNDEASLRKWCQEITYLAEPVVLVLATHGCERGIQVDGKTIGPQALADSLRHAGSLKLLHFSACLLMKDRLGQEMQAALGKQATFGISGYTTTVDWAASAIIEFMYLDLVLVRGLSPQKAADQLGKLLPFAGDKDVQGTVMKGAGFRLLPAQTGGR